MEERLAGDLAMAAAMEAVGATETVEALMGAIGEVVVEVEVIWELSRAAIAEEVEARWRDGKSTELEALMLGRYENFRRENLK